MAVAEIHKLTVDLILNTSALTTALDHGKYSFIGKSVNKMKLKMDWENFA